MKNKITISIKLLFSTAPIVLNYLIGVFYLEHYSELYVLIGLIAIFSVVVSAGLDGWMVGHRTSDIVLRPYLVQRYFPLIMMLVYISILIWKLDISMYLFIAIASIYVQSALIVLSTYYRLYSKRLMALVTDPQVMWIVFIIIFSAAGTSAIEYDFLLNLIMLIVFLCAFAILRYELTFKSSTPGDGKIDLSYRLSSILSRFSGVAFGWGVGILIASTEISNPELLKTTLMLQFIAVIRVFRSVFSTWILAPRINHSASLSDLYWKELPKYQRYINLICFVVYLAVFIVMHIMQSDMKVIILICLAWELFLINNTFIMGVLIKGFRDYYLENVRVFLAVIGLSFIYFETNDLFEFGYIFYIFILVLASLYFRFYSKKKLQGV